MTEPVYICGWSGCNALHVDWKIFRNHVQGHTKRSSSRIFCLWRDWCAASFPFSFFLFLFFFSVTDHPLFLSLTDLRKVLRLPASTNQMKSTCWPSMSPRTLRTRSVSKMLVSQPTTFQTLSRRRPLRGTQTLMGVAVGVVMAAVM